MILVISLFVGDASRQQGGIMHSQIIQRGSLVN